MKGENGKLNIGKHSNSIKKRTKKKFLYYYMNVFHKIKEKQSGIHDWSK